LPDNGAIADVARGLKTDSMDTVYKDLPADSKK
jgi:hypothetical protein